MENMNDKMFIRHCVRYEFHQRKSAAQAYASICSVLGDEVVSKSTCEFWFRRFRAGNFDVNDHERSGATSKVKSADLQALLDTDSSQTQKELAENLRVSQQTISNRLRAMGKIHKEGKWIPHKLSQKNKDDRIIKCSNLLNKQHRKSFLWKIVTGDEKWIYYENPKRRKHWVDPGQSTGCTPKRPIHCKKVMLCIWWDMKGVLYHELLQQGETVNADRYKHQLQRLNEEIDLKRSFTGKGRRPIKLLHDNARPHIARSVKDTLLTLGWEVLEHPAYSPDIAPSDYHLFRSMQNSLTDVHFETLEEVRKWVDDFIKSKDEKFFYIGIHSLPEKWLKVIDNNGEYFDD